MTTPAGSRSLDAWPPVHLVASLAMRSIEAGEEELSMMTKIVDKMTKDLDIRLYHDGYKERIEALITSKMKGEVAQVEWRSQRSLSPRA